MRTQSLIVPALLMSVTACQAPIDDLSLGEEPDAEMALDDRTEPDGPIDEPKRDEPKRDEPTPRTSCDEATMTELKSIADGMGVKLADRGAPGYAIVVSRRIKETQERCVASRANGFAKSVQDGYVSYDIDTRTPVGSISKFVMAAVVLEVLDNESVPLYAQIGDYLPKDWSLGMGVAKVTFHELLRHRSGLLKNSSWALTNAQMESWLGNSVGAKDFEYNNSGYNLLMFITARIADPTITDTNQAGIWMENYVTKHFLTPNGIPSGSADAPACTYDSDEVLAYPKGAMVGTAVGGKGPSKDGRMGCGSALFNSSMRDLGLFADKLHHQELFNPFWTYVMKLNDYGFDPRKGCDDQSCPRFTTAGDQFQSKGGYLPFSETGGFKAGVGFFPNDTVIVFSLNGGDVATSMQDAWDERIH